MVFEEILEAIVEKIASNSKFSKEQIRQSLSVYRDSNSDFLLFLNKVSSSPVVDAENLYNTLLEKKIPEIENLACHDTHLSFNLNKKMFFKDILCSMHSRDIDFGKSNVGKRDTVVVDFSSPNIAKLFHVGHYRTTVLGNFIKNLMKNAGYNVVSLNYLGDWGKQFGLVLLGFEMFGSEDELEKNALMHLFEVYVKINKEAANDPAIHDNARNIFREMEEFKNEKYMSLWRKFREMSINNFKRLYKQLNIEFDVYSGESFYYESAKEFASSTSIATTEEDGSKVIDCAEYGNALIQKSDGTTLYLTRDICSAIDRITTYNAKKLVYVVSCEQDLHFKQLFSCLEKLGYDRSMFEHVNYGSVKGMSTRGGTVHFLEDIIQTSSEAIKARLLVNEDMNSEDIEKTAKILAISTLLVADFSAKRIKGYAFDFEKRANCEKGSGAYLQYAHCRLHSIEKNNSSSMADDLSSIDFSVIDVPEIHDLCYRLLWYERILNLCLEDYEPSRLVLYLMDLAKTINNLITKFRVLGESEHIAKARLLMFSACRTVIRNGLLVLGITPLNKM
ncbi:arginine-tRNA ligase [Vittaforma corneae ATCC 50505]|uniref:arginine--tRNA ligase n=1 Tax=Vittaforma corneae (strain ATCC 50505) TaxID=993615 RepID=L2GP99_VITCO|nr:arginine-tRNA ligase [Vittaforma corneae ATCC 50505]ELA42340.1 arginine-tRNA ligase [Vittaforma corneae ATCC 50505]